MNDKVSIIIPTYNRKKLISQCIESVFCLNYTNYEVIVLDDASDDDTSAYITSNFQNVTIIRNNKKRGPAYCKNQGILKSKGQFVWFLDSDSVIIDNDCLTNMVAIANDNENIGCLGGELLKEGDSYFVRIDEVNRSRKVPYREEEKNKFNMISVRSLMTCNLFVKKQILLDLGGFDTNYFYISEDTDICERCHSLGFDIVLDHKTLVLHLYSMVTRKSNYYMLFRNEIRCAIKNHGITNGLLKEPTRLFKNLYHAAKVRITGDKSMLTFTNIMPLGKKQRALNLFRLGISVGIGFISAYIWNILFLCKTIYCDKRTNYLKNTIV